MIPIVLHPIMNQTSAGPLLAAVRRPLRDRQRRATRPERQPHDEEGSRPTSSVRNLDWARFRPGLEGLSLVLAFVIFAQDRAKSERSQVD